MKIPVDMTLEELLSVADTVDKLISSYPNLPLEVYLPEQEKYFATLKPTRWGYEITIRPMPGNDGYGTLSSVGPLPYFLAVKWAIQILKLIR